MKLSENIYAFHHYALKAEDFDKTVKFYEHLGFQLIHNWSLPDFNLERGGMLHNGKINMCIEIFDKNADIPAQGRKRKSGEEFVENSILHICFTVKDAAEARMQAIAAGAKDLSGGVDAISLTNGHKSVDVRNSLVYSPNGEVIEFLEEVAF